MEHLQEFVPSRKCKKINNKKSPQTYLVWFQKLKTLFHWSFLQVIGLVVLVSFDLIEWKLCFLGMNVVNGLMDHCKDPNHMRSINRNCLAHFSIKRLYTRPNVVEITFYHHTHIRTNGNLAHNACDPRSTSQMSMYAPCVFHKLKEFIWTQC